MATSYLHPAVYPSDYSFNPLIGAANLSESPYGVPPDTESPPPAPPSQTSNQERPTFRRGLSAPSFGYKRRGPKPGVTPAINSYRWLLSQAPVSSDKLDEIRAKAHAMWTDDKTNDRRQASTYLGHFSDKVLDEATTLRPTSPTRMNNPHPPIIFQTCRLHHVPGFNNADVVIGKPPYRVDRGLSADQKVGRDRLRDKYKPRPSTAALAQYRGDMADETIGPKSFGEDPVSSYAVDKLIPAASSGDDPQDVMRRELAKVTMGGASLHRYLKPQGPHERQRLSFTRPSTAAPRLTPDMPSSGAYFSGYVSGVPCSRSLRPSARLENTSRLIYNRYPNQQRANYAIHAGWPSTISHHKVT